MQHNTFIILRVRPALLSRRTIAVLLAGSGRRFIPEFTICLAEMRPRGGGTTLTQHLIATTVALLLICICFYFFFCRLADFCLITRWNLLRTSNATVATWASRDAKKKAPCPHVCRVVKGKCAPSSLLLPSAGLCWSLLSLRLNPCEGALTLAQHTKHSRCAFCNLNNMYERHVSGKP